MPQTPSRAGPSPVPRRRRGPARPALTLDHLEARRLLASFAGLGAPALLSGATNDAEADVNAISADGSTVVGDVVDVPGGFGARWNTADGSLSFLSPTGSAQATATDVSADGSAIALVSSQQAPYLWTSQTGQLQPIPLPHSSFPNNDVTLADRLYISGDGSTVTGVEQSSGVFRWTAAGGTSIVMPGAVYTQSGVTYTVGGVTYAGISSFVGASADGGAVAGSLYTSYSGGHESFRWQNGAISLLQDGPNSLYNPGSISPDGSVVIGVQETFSGQTETLQGFLWGPGGVTNFGPVTTQSQPLPGQPPSALQFFEPVAASNGAATIVGWQEGFDSSGYVEATIWDATNGLRKLQDVLDADGLGAALEGWHLTRATAITPDGSTIAGIGIDPKGLQEPWVARLTSLPDIAMTGVTLPAKGSVGFTYNVSGNPGPVVFGLYASANPTIYPLTNVQLIGGQVISVAADASGSGTFTLPDTFTTDPSRPYLVVVADPDTDALPHGLIAESNENNNVAALALPDIGMLGARVVSPTSVSFTYSVTGNPGSVTFGVYQSATTTFDPATATPLGTQAIDVTPAASAGGSITLANPIPGDATRPYILVVADPANVILESNEGNNVASAAYVASTIALVITPNTSNFGQSVTMTATVSGKAPGGATPSGTVAFVTSTELILGTATLKNGVATLKTKALPGGIHPDVIYASYSGDATFAPSTVTVNQVVFPAFTTTTLAASANPSILGQSVTFTATVAAIAPGSGTPDGTVTFKDGTATLGTATLAGGKATFKTPGLAAGAHSITAAYGGDAVILIGFADFSASTSAALTDAVLKATTTAAAPSTTTPVRGQAVTLYAAVTVLPPGVGTPTGTVTFKDGSTVLGTGTLATVNGTPFATFTTSALALGAHAITAAYGGDALDAASMSAAVTVTVGPDATKTIAAPSAATPVRGQALILYAVVAPLAPGSGTPTGTVTFKYGTAVLATEPLVTVNGTTYAQLATPPMGLGTYTFTTAYSGDSGDLTSVGTMTFTVGPDATKVVAWPSISAPAPGQPVTLYAAVADVPPGAGTPTGTVTFKYGSTALVTVPLVAANGLVYASWTTPPLGAASYTFTAVYNGDPGDLPGTGTITFAVGAAAPALSGLALPAASAVAAVIPQAAPIPSPAPAPGPPPPRRPVVQAKPTPAWLAALDEIVAESPRA